GDAKWGRSVSEAQRFYEHGLRLCQDGHPEEARQIWRNLVHTFQGVEAERRWVRLAEYGLASLPERSTDKVDRWGSVRQALQRARDLHQAGKTKEAEEIRQGIEELYRGDPTAKEILEQVQKDRDR